MSNREQVMQTAIEAATTPAVKASAVASTVAAGGDWLSSGAGVIAMIGLALTAATFILNAWSIWRRDRREQEAHESRMRAQQ